MWILNGPRVDYFMQHIFNRHNSASFMWHVGDEKFKDRSPGANRPPTPILRPQGRNLTAYPHVLPLALDEKKHFLKKHFVADNFLLWHFNNVHLFHLFALVLSGQPFWIADTYETSYRKRRCTSVRLGKRFLSPISLNQRKKAVIRFKCTVQYHSLAFPHDKLVHGF